VGRDPVALHPTPGLLNLLGVTTHSPGKIGLAEHQINDDEIDTILHTLALLCFMALPCIYGSVFQPSSSRGTFEILLRLWRNPDTHISANLRILTEPMLKNTYLWYKRHLWYFVHITALT